MKALEVDHKDTLDTALDNIVEKRNIDLRDLNTKNLKSMSLSINTTLHKEGAPILVNQEEIDMVINSYLRRR